MGKLVQGILGGISGKVGTVIGSIRNGKAYVSGLRTSNKNPRTIRQQTQRMRFKLAQQLVSPASDFVKIGFRNYAIDQYARNVAMSRNLKVALTGEYPTFGIDPSMVVFALGKLSGADDCKASVANNKVSFSWTDNSGEDDAQMSDFAMVMVYNFTKRKVVDSLEVASRMDGKVSVKIPASWSKDKLSCYIAFASVENEAVSDSIYIGDVKSDGSVVEGANGIIIYEESKVSSGSSSSDSKDTDSKDPDSDKDPSSGNPTTPSGSGSTVDPGDSGDGDTVGME